VSKIVKKIPNRLEKMSENLRSFILQSVTGQQGVAYHHIILLALSLKFLKKQVLKLRGKCRSRQPTLISGPRQEEPPRVSAYTLYFQKPQSSVCIFVAGCMVNQFLHSILCSGLQKKHLFCTNVRLGHSRSFRVIRRR